MRLRVFLFLFFFLNIDQYSFIIYYSLQFSKVKHLKLNRVHEYLGKVQKEKVKLSFRFAIQWAHWSFNLRRNFHVILSKVHKFMYNLFIWVFCCWVKFYIRHFETYSCNNTPERQIQYFPIVLKVNSSCFWSVFEFIQCYTLKRKVSTDKFWVSLTASKIPIFIRQECLYEQFVRK